MAIEHTTTQPWRERVDQALADSRLRQKVELSTTRFVGSRLAALAKLPDAQALRRRGREIRAWAVAHLDELHARLRQRVEARGGHVHLARTGEEAVRVVLEVARRRGARRIVKSKSMVCEEIGLGASLAAAGMEAVETDLGEYIVQLAGEAPAHLIAPALHKSRQEIAALFSAAGGRPVGAETGELTAFARRELREKFLTADMGVTGGNFLVAETGTLVLVSNEGNARMVTSLPPVHIAIVGLEKVVPRLEDLPPLLSLLTRSATGQKITVYVSLITGPRGPGEADGPEEFHLILLDNGRRRLLGTPYEEVLYCIRCGACLNVCPVYRQIGGQAYGSPYSGPIGAVFTPLVGGLDEWAVLPKASSLCAACWEACPVGIHLHDHLVRLRQDEVREGRADPGQRQLYAAWGWLWSDARRYRWFVRLARAAQRLVAWGGSIRWAPGLLGGWTRSRDLPPIAARTFRERWAERRARPGALREGGAAVAEEREPAPLAARFASQLASLGVGVRWSEPGSLRAAVVGALREAGARTVVRWAVPELDALELEADFDVTAWDEGAPGGAAALRAAAAAADAGVVWADWAVAETGTLALAAGPGRGRLVSLLPPRLVAVVRQSDIVPTLEDGLARLAGMPAALNLVTGPSRSADIEGDLALGVHGPGRMWVVVAGSASIEVRTLSRQAEVPARGAGLG